MKNVDFVVPEPLDMTPQFFLHKTIPGPTMKIWRHLFFLFPSQETDMQTTQSAIDGRSKYRTVEGGVKEERGQGKGRVVKVWGNVTGVSE